MKPSARSLISQIGTATLSEAGDRYATLKELAKGDRPVLQHLASLKALHAQDPQLTGKEASNLMQAIMMRLFQKDETSALTLGRVTCEPDIVAWMGFFDELGDQELGDFLGIASTADLPAPVEPGAEPDLEGEPPAPAAPTDEVPLPDDPESDPDVAPPAPAPVPAAESAIPARFLRLGKEKTPTRRTSVSELARQASAE